MIAITSILIILIAIFALWKIGHWLLHIRKLKKQLAWIPGPPGIPILGNIVIIFRSKFEVIKLFYGLYKTYGGIFILWIGPYPVIFMQSAEYLKIISKLGKDIKKGKEYDYASMFVGDGLLFSTGEKWQERRKLLTLSFHMEILEDFIEPMWTRSKILVEKLKTFSNTNEEFNILDYVKLCALDIMMDTAIGKSIDAQDNPQSEYVNAIESMSVITVRRSRSVLLDNNFLFSLTYYKYQQNKARKIIKEFSSKAILEKRELRKKFKGTTKLEQKKGKKQLALLDSLLELEESNMLHDSDVQAEVDTFVFAGHDTTSITISLVLYLLGKHPELQVKILEELDEYIPDFITNGATTKQLNKLDLLERCIKETLRLFPSAVLISRRLISDLEIENGKMIPVDEEINLVVNFYNLHRDEQFFEEPNKFDPDRFLLENSKIRDPFAYLPFFAGPRNCIGQKFAMLELKVVLATILKFYIVSSPLKLEDLQIYPNIVIGVKDGVKLQIKKRKSI